MQKLLKLQIIKIDMKIEKLKKLELIIKYLQLESQETIKQDFLPISHLQKWIINGKSKKKAWKQTFKLS